MKWHPVFCMLAISAFTVPMLTPCTLGLGTAGSKLLDSTTDTLTPGPLNHLPSKQLLTWAVKPGPELTVLQNQAVNRASLIATDELVNARQGSRTESSVRRGMATVTKGLADLLAMSDVMTLELTNSTRVSGGGSAPRQQVVLSESPYVILQGEQLRCTQENPGQVRLALASTRAKLTVITPEGSYFALANRIHFRHGSSEIILEGNPMIQSGHQHISDAKAEALMSLSVSKKTVRVSGVGKETRW